jgi:ribonuclease HII
MTYPDFSFENILWGKGYRYVLGVDEVGRGALAGPVVVGAAALKKFQIPNDKFQIILKNINELKINDSKKLSAKKRIILDVEIKKYFHTAVGEVDAGFINSFGIVAATQKAVRQAVLKLLYRILADDYNPDKKMFNPKEIRDLKAFLLLDAFHVRYVPVVGLKNQKAIVGGDGKSITIAAGSITAKVYRDRKMIVLGAKFPVYHWDENSGYGTKVHTEAIVKYGKCLLHRNDFIKRWVNN